MPNTLAHLGCQAVVTRCLVRNADPKWIYVGCVIPDFPWILLRIVPAVVANINPYDSYLYGTVQASLALCLVLCAALATSCLFPRRIFAVLALNSFLHLLLDACETKWANGVHLLAPISWKLWNLALFWPESLPTSLLTFLGLAYVICNWQHAVETPVNFSSRGFWKRFLALALITAYFVLPLILKSGPELADNHSIITLREVNARTGRHVEFDRKLYLHHANGDVIRAFAKEELVVTGMTSKRTGVVSVRAKFLDEKSIVIQELHEHSAWSRDYPSYLGLSLILLVWTSSIRRSLTGREAIVDIKGISTQ